MERIKIGIICASHAVVDMARIIAEQKGLEVASACVGLGAAAPIAMSMEREGSEAILSRGGTVRVAREHVRIPVISLPQSATDILACMKEASAYGKNILYISFQEMISGLDFIEELLGCNLSQMICRDQADLERLISLSCKQFDVVIGGLSTIRMAKKYGMNVVETKTPEEVIRSAIENAISVIRANREEQKKTMNFRCIIDSVSEGVISFDHTGKMTNINIAAKTLLNLDNSEDIAEAIGKILKKPSLNRAIKTQKPVLDRVEDFNDEKYVFSHLPIILNGRTTGCVTTFKAISNVIRVESEVRKSLSKGFAARYTFNDLIHRSRIMDELIARATHFASSRSTILIIGETGTGKEILAQSIHNWSPLSQNPFVSINCAALSEQLLESELFGYEEGAFTGSKKGGKPGLFEISHTGTIFLDEITATSQRVQRHLLRVLQEREVMRVGADSIVPVSVRVIAASNDNIENEVYSGAFREDLFFRLNILRIKIPALRERLEDIPVLMEHFIGNLAREYHSTPFKIPLKYLVKLQQYPWPGNVRQLQNFTERLYILSGNEFKSGLFEELYTELIQFLPRSIHHKDPSIIHEGMKGQHHKAESFDESETIRKAIETSGYNKSAAARKLGISRTTLWKRMKNGY
jgi:transcriptional regulator with PAS, ATPase and Fis domain